MLKDTGNTITSILSGIFRCDKDYDNYVKVLKLSVLTNMMLNCTYDIICCEHVDIYENRLKLIDIIDIIK